MPPPDIQTFCDVCAILDEDRSPKLVRYCSACKAWMCERCRDDLLRRFRAAAARAFHPIRLPRRER